MPILAPLGDLVGVARQTSVLAHQLGDLPNIFTPTCGYFMAGLALIGVPWTRWVVLWPPEHGGSAPAVLRSSPALRWGRSGERPR
jgi:hypothetical protein